MKITLFQMILIAELKGGIDNIEVMNIFESFK